jgi:hypothetical protein
MASPNQWWDTDHTLTASSASHFAQLVLKSVQREYPNYLQHALDGPDDARTPRELHPAFYGCFDWHSCVHGHWMLAHLVRRFPDLTEAPEIRSALNTNLTVDNLLAETAYLTHPGRQSFERPYGWAWLLKLDMELLAWEDADARRWHQNLQPLSRTIVAKHMAFLPKQNYPIRAGVHSNTAFGLVFALDYARAVGNTDLERLIVERSRTYFEADADYPTRFEPSGDDFLSPALIEADLMRRVLPLEEFRNWFARFLPDLSSGAELALLKPAEVLDRTDPKLVHLDGLNLSRAWCLRTIAQHLSTSDPAKESLEQSAREHAAAALPHIASGDYMGEHWLATFAVYLLAAEEE